MTKPTIGRIVTYTVSEQDAEKINRRRISLSELAEKLVVGFWHSGAQAHVGNLVIGGQKFPMMIVAVHGDSNESSVNGQVFMDGNDQFWTLSVSQDDSGKPGTYHFPAITGVATVPKATARTAAQPSRPSAPKEDEPTEPPKE
jgi:hypothetical protein